MMISAIKAIHVKFLYSTFFGFLSTMMLSTKSNYSFPRFIIIQIPKVFGDEKVDVDSTDRHASVWYSVVVLENRIRWTRTGL